MTRLNYFLGFLLVLALSPFIANQANAQDEVQDILIGAELTAGFDMGMNSSRGMTDWLESENTDFIMSYPANQSWGAVFITVGKPTDPPRPSRDFSAYRTLSIEMKGGPGSRTIDIGIKTNTQKDDGSETKKTVTLTQDWQVYEFSLSDFKGADLSRLYVVTEFVFAGSQPQTVYFRNIRYMRRGPRPTR